MRLVFWLCLALTAYAYFGYAVLLWVYTRVRPRPVRSAAIMPEVSIVMAVRNEEANLPTKLKNLDEVEYPQERLQIVIASDGSTDATQQILMAHGGRVLPVLLEQSNGKASALNAAVRHATGEILVFLDARQHVEKDAVSKLVACFADRSVGAASGELILATGGGDASSDGLGIYWIIEKAVRKLESTSGSVIGVTGAIYAIRRELYTEIPAGTILDDVFVPMHVARKGMRVVFQPAAVARDRLFVAKGKEFSRKVRTLTGNYQLLQIAPWLLTPANPLLFRFISHKLLRLAVPLFLVLMLVASGLSRGPLYQALFWMQVLFYALAAWGAVNPASRKLKPVAIANTFVLLNAAAAMAFYNFLAGRNKVWV